MLEEIAECIVEGQDNIAIQLKSRGAFGGHSFDRESQAILPNASVRIKDFQFPGSTPRETWKFTVVLRILSLIFEALTTHKVVTKREIYYMDRDLFERQGVVDAYVDDIACTFGVKRRSLNVVATAKGLIAGNISILRKDGSTLDCSTEVEGALIPDITTVESLSLSQLKWILVVEKEATFHALASTAIWRRPRLGHGVIVTAKGYPDISTRAFLHLLSACAADLGPSSPKLYGLADLDPDGLVIISTYKYGSVALAHENQGLNIPNLRWIGLNSSDVYSINEASEGRGLLSLTPRDRRQAKRFLEKEIFSEAGPEPEWRRELQIMLFTNVKAEIQIMNEGSETFDGWLENKLAAEMARS